MPVWSGDYVRDMFDPENQYIRNMTQKKKPIPPADLNEARQQAYEYFRMWAHKYFGDSLFIGDAWLCTGVGDSNSFDLGPGYAYLHGHPAYGHASAKYENNGDSKTKKNLCSVSTGLTATVLTDSAMSWVVNELVGRSLIPDITEGSGFTITANTSSTITVTGDMTVVAVAGDYYRISLSTPSGSDRTDTVWLNLYLDEIDATEDSNLTHAIGAGKECDRRIKARTIVQVEQGTSNYANYTDADSHFHVVIKLATIARYDGVAAVVFANITDQRSRLIEEGKGGEGNKVQVSASDSKAWYLDQKVVQGTGIALSTVPGAQGDALQIAAPGSTTDEKVSVSSDDTTPGLLNDKTAVGSFLKKEKLNPSGNEQLKFSRANGTAGTVPSYVAGGAPGLVVAGTSGQVLKAQGAALPQFQNPNIQVSELADGTDGQVLTWDSDGHAIVVGPGIAGQVLTSRGVGLDCAFQDLPSSSPGSWIGKINWNAMVNDSGASNPLTSPVLTWPVGTKYLVWTVSFHRCFVGFVGAHLVAQGTGYIHIVTGSTYYVEWGNTAGDGGSLADWYARQGSASTPGLPYTICIMQPSTMGFWHAKKIDIVGITLASRQIQLKMHDECPGSVGGVGMGVNILFNCFRG